MCIREQELFQHLLRNTPLNGYMATFVVQVCLAKEAGIAYTSIALATDYDCWKEDNQVPSPFNQTTTHLSIFTEIRVKTPILKLSL